MTLMSVKVGAQMVLERDSLQNLFDVLTQRGYQIIGPTVQEGAIVYEPIRSVSDLPAGWTDEQNAGKYRLRKRSDDALFGFTVGPQSWKKFLYSPVLRLWQSKRKGSGLQIETDKDEQPKYAFLGVRSCELHAIAVQDRVFLHGEFAEPNYAARREGLFTIAVNCSQGGGTCFCVSMGTGPKVSSAFDIAMTEVIDGGRHYFVVEAGSDQGAEVLRELPVKEAKDQEVADARTVVAEAAAQMGRSVEVGHIREILSRNLEHPQWEEVGERCLSCANCTMVCPTCFCHTVEDVTDLAGESAERWRKWDSCFTVEFSYIHGGSVRQSVMARYRQFVTHKFMSWVDQFGTPGCVGCGRCITWCPVGIDITEQIRAIRENSRTQKETADEYA